jgi:regulatory protein
MRSQTTKESDGPGSGPAQAKLIVGRMLGRRAHSESEVRQRLSDGGFDGETIDATIEWLCQNRLVDDADFARSWVEERVARKGFGPARLRAELEAKGIAAEIIDVALAERGGDEVERARAIALKQLDRLTGLPLLVQARRLQGLLLRRGFSPEAVRVAMQAVLPPDGWD